METDRWMSVARNQLRIFSIILTSFITTTILKKGFPILWVILNEDIFTLFNIFGMMSGLCWISFRMIALAISDAEYVYPPRHINYDLFDRWRKKSKYFATIFSNCFIGIGIAVIVFDASPLPILYGAIIGASVGDKWRSAQSPLLLQMGLTHISMISLGVLGGYLALNGPLRLIKRGNEFILIIIDNIPFLIQLGIDFIFGVIIGIPLAIIFNPVIMPILVSFFEYID